VKLAKRKGNEREQNKIEMKIKNKTRKTKSAEREIKIYYIC